MNTSISRNYFIDLIYRGNSVNFYNQMQSNNKVNENGWGTRYARRMMNWNALWEEDKKILEEHLEQIKMKKCNKNNFNLYF